MAFEGMLAKAGDADLLDQYQQDGFSVEPKFDGIRFLLYIKDGTVEKLISRGMIDDAEKYPFLDGVFNLQGETVFDGEMVVLKNSCMWLNDLPALQSINGSLPEKARSRCQEHNVRFIIFDVLKYEDTDLRGSEYWVRKGILTNILDNRKELNFPKEIIFTGDAFYNCKGFYNNIVSSGGEGVMLKHKNSLYKRGRFSTWLKIKHTETAIGQMVASTPGKGRNAGLVGSIIVVGTESGEKFKGCFGAMSDVMRKDFSDENGKLKKEWVGTRVLVRYYPGGVKALRHCTLVKIL